MSPTYQYPFVALVGQEKMKPALIANVVDPTIGGVLVRGEKGTAKSTAVRGLADVLPLVAVVEGCPYRMPQYAHSDICALCSDRPCHDGSGGPTTAMQRIRVVELPVGATEDRLVGTLNLEHALKSGEKRFEPGILARAHRGILYVDEVNLLEDHLVDVLLDSAAMGVNTVEREGISITHPARFTLVGTMNPEEGDLRPQLLDRFGLCVTVEGILDADSRVEIIERRLRFDENPTGFIDEWSEESSRLAERIREASDRLKDVVVPREILRQIARGCAKLGIDGHRGDIVTLKTAKVLAAYDGRMEVSTDDAVKAAELALPHRVRRTPFDDVASEVAAEIARALTV